MKRLIFSALIPLVWLLAPGSVLADNFVAGMSSNVDVPLTTDAQWEVVRWVVVTIPSADAGAHSCVVNASADVKNPKGTRSTYLFDVTHNAGTTGVPGPGGNTGSERRLEFVDNPNVDDPDSLPVSTTKSWTGLTNSNGWGLSNNLHYFYFLGRKDNPAALNTAVDDGVVTVVCVETP